SIRLDLARPPPRSTLFPYTTLFRSRERRLDRNVGLRLRKAAEQIELERVGQPLLKSRRELIEFGLALARIAFGTDIDIVEIGRDKIVVRIDHIIGDIDAALVAAQQHLSPIFVPRFLEGRIEAVDRDFGVLARFELNRCRCTEALAVVADEAVARNARMEGL